MATISQPSAIVNPPAATVAEDSRLRVALRPMTMADIVEVTMLDRMSFPNPWPIQTYEFEIRDSDRARMFVLEPAGLPPARAGNGRSRAWWERLLGLGASNGHRSPQRLIGFSAMWRVIDEAHISSIAVHPDWRGKKLGELLVWAMMRQAVREGAAQMTLEVRVSNTLAQNLYKKYGFEVMGLRKGYYRDNREDAFMMAVQPLDSRYREKLVALGKDLTRALKVADHW